MPLAAVICAVRHRSLKSTPQINHMSGLHVQMKAHLSHTGPGVCALFYPQAGST